MLAYLDDILEPADSQELGKKIEESEFASTLVHRIRTSVRRLGLGAPKLEGKGMGLDPNTVAEYLDNTLSPESVPDFEKVCLESDVHLAEAAACHQVLTLVLGEPADVEPATRERLYRIISRTVTGRTEDDAEELGVDAAAAGVVPPPKVDMPESAETSEQQVAREKREVPDYLKSGRSFRWWPIAVTLVLAFLLAGAVFMAMGPPPWFGGDAKDPGTPTAVLSGDDAKTPQDPDAPAPDAPVDKADGGKTDPTQDRFPDEPTDSADPIDTPPAKTPDTDVTDTPTDPDDVPVDPRATVPGTDDGSGLKIPTDLGDPTGGDVDDDDATPGDDTTPSDDTGTGVDTGTGGEPKDPGTPADAPVKPDIDPGEVVGRYVSKNQVLVQYSSSEANWFRVPTRQSLTAGSRLLALPTYRPQMLIGSVQLTLDGGTRVRLMNPDERDVPQLQIESGRIRLASADKTPGQIILHIGKRHGTVAFGDAESAVAVQVDQYHDDGANPESVPAHTLCKLYTTSGSASWKSGTAEPEVINAGQVHVFFDETKGSTTDAGEAPKWIASRDISEINQRASTDLEPLLAEGRPMTLSLEEKADKSNPKNRRVELRSLSVCCLVHLEQHDAFVAALQDDRLKSYWADHVDAVKQVLAQSPESAARVRAAFEKHRGDEGKALYRLLWGFSQEQLQAEKLDGVLVGYLEHESLDFRVLAIENLRRITGKTKSYRPEHHGTSANRGHVRKWQEALKEHEIRHETAPKPAPAEKS